LVEHNTRRLKAPNDTGKKKSTYDVLMPPFLYYSTYRYVLLVYKVASVHYILIHIMYFSTSKVTVIHYILVYIMYCSTKNVLVHICTKYIFCIYIHNTYQYIIHAKYIFCAIAQ
jgi:hypothetical protein